MTNKPNPYLIDDDAPKLTAEDFAKAMPFYEAFPELRPLAHLATRQSDFDDDHA